MNRNINSLYKLHSLKPWHSYLSSMPSFAVQFNNEVKNYSSNRS